MTTKKMEVPTQIKLDLNWNILRANGESFGNAATGLAQILETTQIANVVAEKAQEWAKQLYNQKIRAISIDKADYKALKSFLTKEHNPSMMPLATYAFQKFFEKIDKTLGD